MNWHRLFGLILTDFFTGTPFVVELEKDLSAKQQFLDVVVVRRGKGRFRRRPPDGLDDLAAHNLITFKSHHDALDDWVLKELTGHYVNYRKQVSPSMQTFLPEEQFKLYAVCSRFPQNLADQGELQELQQGVYQCRRGTDLIRVIVAGQLPQQEHNAPLHLFSARLDQVNYGRGHFQQQTQDASTVLQDLFVAYQQEGIAMSYTMQDYKREYMQEEFLKLTQVEREALLAKLPAEELLQVLSAEQIEAYLKRSQQSAPKRKRTKRS